MPAVQHIDLMPTILEYLGQEIPEVVQGRSLIGKNEIEGEIYSHLFLSGYPLYFSVVDGEWKLIRRIDEDGSQTYQLFNWVEDPGETCDLAQEQSKRTAALSRLLEARLAADGEGEVAEEIPLTEELQEELEALGYLQ